MYAVSFGILGAQFVADAFGVTITNFEGTAIKSNILSMIDVDALNTSTLNAVNTNQTTITTDPIIAAAGLALELFLLLTGTYVFNIMILFGVPVIFVSGFVLLYLIMLIRTFIAYLRGI